jgi:hypothetical protein
VERRLQWEALRNARDLGGLPLAGGGTTRFGAIVRSDTLRQLTPLGWQSLVDHGVRTILDLRFQVEIDADEPLDSGPGGLSRPLAGGPVRADVRPQLVSTVVVSLLGEPDPSLGARFDELSRAQPAAADSTRAVYLEMLELFRPRFAAAVMAIADADDGGVLVHCHAGKDRTGLLVALLLEAVGVAATTIAADYALSGANLVASLVGWIEDADDPEEREHRRRVAAAPRRAMLDVLAALRERYGGATRYLLEAGATESHLAVIRGRLGAG